MKKPKHCKQYMKFVNSVARISSWNLFFECVKCGEIIVLNRPEFANFGRDGFNINLKEDKK